ncbi:MAG: hypothetical protein JST48_07130 [Bacteroidetes bacterium]|nr:hypothetical protein [Bacteroidota bacterium]
MKLPLVFVILFTGALNCSAQEFKKVRVGFAFGTGSGIVASQELGYRVADKILIGIRLEGKAFFASTETGSYGVNSQYYFSNRNLRPFVGLGISLYHSGLVGDPFYGYGSRTKPLST